MTRYWRAGTVSLAALSVLLCLVVAHPVAAQTKAGDAGGDIETIIIQRKPDNGGEPPPESGAAAADSESAAQPYVPGTEYPNLDIRGRWKIEDASEPPGQPKTIEILGSKNSYIAFFVKNNNTCPTRKKTRDVYMYGIKVGVPEEFKIVGGKKISGNLIMRASLITCSPEKYLKLCGGEELQLRNFSGVLEINPETGNAVRIRGGYKGKYSLVEGEPPNTTCTRKPDKDFERFVTLTPTK